MTSPVTIRVGTRPEGTTAIVRQRRAERRATLILLGPALTFLALLSIWPFAYLLYASFTSYQLAIPVPTEWVGLA